MIEYVLLGAGWLLLSLPVSVLVGKCISIGQAGETARHAAFQAVAPATSANRSDGSAGARADSAAVPALPTQREPAASRTRIR